MAGVGAAHSQWRGHKGFVAVSVRHSGCWWAFVTVVTFGARRVDED
jgi:hypothetical protein